MRVVTSAFVAALLFAAPAVASASDAQSAGATPITAARIASNPQGMAHVSVDVRHFYATASGTGASGTATATVTPLGQAPTTVHKNVTLIAKTSGKCTVLLLTLEKLELKLLGLDVNLEKVVLTVTGEPHGGVLGSLFCSLAHAKVKATRAAVISRLNAAIRHGGVVKPIAFSAAVSAQTAQAPVPTCPILNLVLGPLHLDLLGLVVDLNEVHLTIVAEPTGGVLGSLFCGLANTKI